MCEMSVRVCRIITLPKRTQMLHASVHDCFIVDNKQRLQHCMWVVCTLGEQGYAREEVNAERRVSL